MTSGLPHLSSQDDVYRGYFIPKGQIDFRLRVLVFFAKLPLIIQSKRIDNGSQCLASRPD